MMKSLGLKCLAVALLVLPLAAQGAIELPLVFSDGVVLQRDQPMRVWGWSHPGARVVVRFDGRQAETKAAADGRWLTVLPAHSPGGPFELSVTDGDDTHVVHDVLVGDVYIASGQSNMEFELSKARDVQVEIAHADDNAIRQFKVPNAWAIEPSDRLPGGRWIAATPATAGNFSAVAWFFARDIRKDQKVPIGIINSSWGGSRIEPWMNARTAGVEASEIQARIQREDANEEAKIAVTRTRLSRWPGVLTSGAGNEARYSSATLDESDWVDIAVPAYWESVGYYGMDGIAWYRTSFRLSADEAAHGITLGLAMIDDSDRTWVNGTLVGATEQAWNGARAYRIAPQVLHAGNNTLAIRVDDLGASGGIHGDASLLYIQSAKGPRRTLTGAWKFRPEAVTLAPAQDKNQIDTLLYNKMIHPLLPLAVRGVLWYQGESNATDTLAWRYREQFASLITQWRGDFQQPALPFLWVQLANWISGGDTSAGSPWAMLRESQSTALALPATAQAVTIDVGNPADIHPTDKQTVGHRLALAARHVVYGETLIYQGPTFRSMQADGNRLRLHFDAGGSPLSTRNGQPLAGFAIAGADRRFHVATARIDGDAVVVENDGVVAPVAVRYGWSDNPADANLINQAGLPASPFRTDTW